MNKDKKAIIIEDSIYLPDLNEIGWGYETSGPVTHPILADDKLIIKLLTAVHPVQFMYVINPDDSAKRVLITTDNYKLTTAELFEVPAMDVEPLEDNNTPDFLTKKSNVSGNQEKADSQTEHKGHTGNQSNTSNPKDVVSIIGNAKYNNNNKNQK